MLYQYNILIILLILFIIPLNSFIQSQQYERIEIDHINNSYKNPIKVYVYHFILNHWGESFNGLIDCDDSNIQCIWTHSDHLRILKQKWYDTSLEMKSHSNVITLSLYNIHSWYEKTRSNHPAVCELHTNLTMAESEESKIRYGHLFNPSFPNFDGTSTTNPASNVQRVYTEAFLYDVNASIPLKYNFSSLVKGASYVASDCHRRDSANSNRDTVVHLIREAGFRIDGLGRCMHSDVPEGYGLPHTPDSRYNLQLKRDTIARYMFYMAFENSIEPGYVTEKPFDALIAGTVPIYLGDAIQLKALLPHPKAAIFLEDFNHNYTALADYLTFLSNNESAYEEHRLWRQSFSISSHIHSNVLLEKPWTCRVCQWAIETIPKHHKRIRICDNDKDDSNLSLDTMKFEGQAIRGSTRQVYYFKNGELHSIPNLETFFHMKLELEKIIQLSDADIQKMKHGDPVARIQ